MGMLNQYNNSNLKFQNGSEPCKHDIYKIIETDSIREENYKWKPYVVWSLEPVHKIWPNGCHFKSHIMPSWAPSIQPNSFSHLKQSERNNFLLYFLPLPDLLISSPFLGKKFQKRSERKNSFVRGSSGKGQRDVSKGLRRIWKKPWKIMWRFWH